MSGWPDHWEDRKRGRDCPMCASLGGGDDDHAVHVTDLPFSEVRLERRSRLPGYCIVVWRAGHVAEPTELDDESGRGYWSDVVGVARVVEVEFEPVKLNLLTLGNLVPHLHTHVVPRYRDDPAPGGPIPWPEIFKPEPTAQDVLQNQAARLRAGLRLPGLANRTV